MNTVPLVDLAAQWRSVGPAVRAAMDEVHAATSYTMGPQLGRFEEDFARYLGVERVLGVADGTRALALILEGLGIGKGDEVVVPAMTFIATAEAVAMVGAWPVLADVELDTGLLSPAAAAAAIGPRTRAIIAVHLYGQPADLDALKALSDGHGLALIEDACQAHGAYFGGRRVGGHGVASAFSFYPSKNLGAYGDGGAVATADASLAASIASLRDHGTSSKYVHERLAGTYRLDTLQAAALAVKLPHLDGWNQARAEHAARYQKLLGSIAGLALPAERPGRTHVWHLYTVRSPRRDALLAALKAEGIGAGIHYPIPLHLQPALAHLGLAAGGFPAAEEIAGTTLSLPLYPELPAGTPERVAAVLTRFRD